ncbi:MAG: CatB-related O-acetyltransferase, partial [Flavobacteriaceae bacterium]|nr:CatB-related O-acetyltransferase [Flavobacteriaceae bacterium]
MAFGISKKFFSFLLNPYLIYVHFKRKKLLKKYREKSLLLDLYVSIYESDIGYHVFLGTGVQLYNSAIGDHSYVNSKSSINYTKIGKFCSIGSNVTMGMGIHPTDLVSTHPAFYSNNKAFKTYADKNYYVEYGNIEIGNDVWVGSNVTILENVFIGDGAIIATGAVVTKDVKPYEIVGGIPAKHIKYRIKEDLIEKIRATKWWDKDENWLQENFHLFLNNDA